MRHACLARLFIDWYLCEERARDLQTFLEETFPGAGEPIPTAAYSILLLMLVAMLNLPSAASGQSTCTGRRGNYDEDVTADVVFR